MNYSSLVVSGRFNNNFIILYKQERLKISYSEYPVVEELGKSLGR